MKKPLAIALGLAIIAAAAGCEAPTPAPAATPKPQNVTIRTVSMFGGTDPSASAYQQLIKDFQAKYPYITVTDESATSDETWKARVTTDFSSDNDPDAVFFFTGADAQQLIENGKVVSVDTIKAEYPGYAGDITSIAMDFMKEPDGKTYAVPVRGFYEGLFCNKDLFDRYGLQLPTTWDNLIRAVTTFKANGVIPIAVSFSDVPHYWIEHLILAEGGVEDHRVNPADAYPASWERALGYFRTLYDMGAFPRDVNATTNDVIGNLFKDKRAAMQMDGSWFVGGVKDQDNTVILPMPSTNSNRKNPTDIIGGFSSGFYVSAKAWNDPAKKDAAVRFVMFMTSKESIALLSKDACFPAADVPQPTGLTNLQKSGMELSANAKSIDMPIDSRMSKAAWNYLTSMTGRIATGKAEPADVMAQAVALNK